ncbi:NADH-quinone oxidoreductase subunit NuoN [Gordonia sinesedis]
MTVTHLAAITPPAIDYGLLSPMLIVFGVGVVGVLVEAFAPRAARYPIQVILCLGGLLAAFAAVVVLAVDFPSATPSTAAGAVIVDGPALFGQGLLVVIAALTVCFMAERRLERVVSSTTPVLRSARNRATEGPGAATRAAFERPRSVRSQHDSDGGVDADMFAASGSAEPNSDAELAATRAGALTTEVFPLVMLAVGGMMLFGASGDLLTMFVALEVFSLPLYLLCGLARRRRLISQEASLKYFLLGSFSSAFFLFGAAFAYGATGSLDLSAIGQSVTATSATGGDTILALIALGMLSVGLLFKVGVVPFQSWVPDVYQGAPTPITAFMAAATKVAAFLALLRVFYVAFVALQDDWEPVVWAVAIATMLAGAIMAATQTDVKRMLAYSSIIHAGFILLGLTAFDDAGLAAVLFYLAAYAFTTFGAFAMVALVREPDRPSGPHLSGREATDLAQWRGLGRRYPLAGAIFSLFLLSFAGIPLTSGFIAKFDVFTAAAGTGGGVLVVVGVISSAIAAYIYIRIIVAMFFADAPADAPHLVMPSAFTLVPIAVCAAMTVVLGIFPQPLLDLTESAGGFLMWVPWVP